MLQCTGSSRPSTWPVAHAECAVRYSQHRHAKKMALTMPAACAASLHKRQSQSATQADNQCHMLIYPLVYLLFCLGSIRQLIDAIGVKLCQPEPGRYQPCHTLRLSAMKQMQMHVQMSRCSFTWCREYNRADTNSKRGRERDERERLRGIERDERDRRRVEAMHAKRYPIDDLDLIAEQRHTSSYTSGSACASLTPVFNLLSPATHSRTSPVTLKIDRSLASCYAMSLRLSALCGWGGRSLGCRMFG